MLVRSATPADLAAMQAIAARAVTAAEWSEGHYQALFALQPPRLALVLEEAEAEAAIEGFVVARAAGPEWEIENIAVAGPARRRGLGTRLLGDLLRRARAAGAEAVFLEVRESNHAARALYEKWAFVEGGRRRLYYRSPDEDAVVYRFSFVENPGQGP